MIDTLNHIADLWGERVWLSAWQGSLFILGVWTFVRFAPRIPPPFRAVLYWLAFMKLALGLVWPGMPVLPYAPPSAPSGLWTSAKAKFAPPPRSPASSPGASPPARPIPARPPVLDPTPALPPIYTIERIPARRGVSPLGWAFLLWVAALVFQGVFMLRLLKGSRRLLSDHTPVSDGEVERAAVEVAAAMRFRGIPRLRESPSAPGPFVAGFLRPAVVLPTGFSERFGPQEVRMALAHEFTHLRRKDLWMGILPGIVRALLFFLPPVRWAYREWLLSVEVACDAEALKWGPPSPHTYGSLLVGLVSEGTFHLAGIWGVSPAYWQLERRLSRLPSLPVRFSPRWRAALASAVACMTVLLLPWQLAYRAAETEYMGQRLNRRSVEGVVLSPDGKPVPGATVTWVNVLESEATEVSVTKSGIGGRFRLSGEGTTDTSLVAEAEGWGIGSIPLKEGKRPVTVRLNRPATLEMNFVDVKGRPVRDDAVRVTMIIIGGSNTTPDDQPFSYHSLPLSMAERHHVRLAGGRDRYTGLALGSSTIVSDTGAPTGRYALGLLPPIKLAVPLTRRTLTLHPGAVIRGRVTFPDSGRPIEGIRVDAQPLDDGVIGKPIIGLGGGHGTTDAHGNYEVRHLFPGRYNVNVGLGNTDLSRQWASRAAQDVTLASGAQRGGLDFRLIRGGRILCRVRDAKTGLPLSRASISLQGPSDPSSSIAIFLAQADDEGKIVACVPPGNQSLNVQEPQSYFPPTVRGYPYKFTVREGEIVRLDFRLRRSPVLTGKVIDRGSGKPVPDFHFMILGPSFKHGGSMMNRVETDEEGAYRVSVPPGYGYEPLFPGRFSVAGPDGFPRRMRLYEERSVNFFVDRDGGIRPRSPSAGRPGRT